MYLCTSQSTGILFRSLISQFFLAENSHQLSWTDSTGICCINTQTVQSVCVLCVWQLRQTDLQTYRNSCGFSFISSTFHSRFLSVHNEVEAHNSGNPHDFAQVETRALSRYTEVDIYTLNVFANICVFLKALYALLQHLLLLRSRVHVDIQIVSTSGEENCEWPINQSFKFRESKKTFPIWSQITPSTLYHVSESAL